MAGIFALLLAPLAFLVPLAVPLFATRWRTLLPMLAVAAAFFGWLTVDLGNPAGIGQVVGPFLGGLMLFGFVAGATAKAIMLLGRR